MFGVNGLEVFHGCSSLGRAGTVRILNDMTLLDNMDLMNRVAAYLLILPRSMFHSISLSYSFLE